MGNQRLNKFIIFSLLVLLVLTVGACGRRDDLSKLFGVTFTVEDEEGNPIKGATVKLGDYEAQETGENGVLELKNIISGAYVYTVEKEGFVKEEATIAIKETASVVVTLTEIPTFHLTLAVSPENTGAVMGGGVFEEGEEVEIVAVAATGFGFANWTHDEAVISEDATYLFTMPAEDVTLLANFQELPTYYILGVELVGQGDVDLDPLPEDEGYEEGTEVTLTATPLADWGFVGWLGDVEDRHNPVTTITMDRDKAITALFEQVAFTIESVEVLDETRLLVKFEEFEAFILITLEEPMIHGENEVTFVYNNYEYTVTVEYEDPAVIEKEEAIAYAVAAIAALPAVEDLTLAHKDAVLSARGLVDIALSLGASEEDIVGLHILEAAELRIIELEAIAAAVLAAETAIAALPAVEDLTLEDKEDVLEARRLVEEAVALGVSEEDIMGHQILEAAELRIAELEAIAAAVLAAETAIAALPAVEDLTLEDKEDVLAARALVEEALDLGAKEEDIVGLDILEAAELRIAELEAIAAAVLAAETAIAALPAVEDLTLEDEEDVLAARALVEEALDLGAKEEDIQGIDKLVAAEARIEELKEDPDVTFDRVYKEDRQTLYEGTVYSGIEEIVPGVYNIYLDKAKIEDAFGGPLEEGQSLKIELDGHFIQGGDGEVFVDQGDWYTLPNVQDVFNQDITINPTTIGYDAGTGGLHPAVVHLITD